MGDVQRRFIAMWSRVAAQENTCTVSGSFAVCLLLVAVHGSLIRRRFSVQCRVCQLRSFPTTISSGVSNLLTCECDMIVYTTVNSCCNAFSMLYWNIPSVRYYIVIVVYDFCGRNISALGMLELLTFATGCLFVLSVTVFETAGFISSWWWNGVKPWSGQPSCQICCILGHAWRKLTDALSTLHIYPLFVSKWSS